MNTFGSQIRYAFRVFDAHSHLVDAGLDAAAVEERAKVAAEYARVVMQVVVSILVLVAGLVLLFKGNEPTQKLASGFIGTVVGYWLR
jgi:hypothetical protein